MFPKVNLTGGPIENLCRLLFNCAPIPPPPPALQESDRFEPPTTDYEKQPGHSEPVSTRKRSKKTRLMTHALGCFYGSVDLVWKHDRNNRLSARRCGSIGSWQPRQAPAFGDTGQCVVDASGFVDVPVSQTVEQLASAFIRRSIDPLFVFVQSVVFYCGYRCSFLQFRCGGQ